MERQLIIDTRQEAYGSFFTDNFAREAFSASDSAPLLKEPIFDLIADWRSASYAGALPAQIPGSIKQFHDAFVNLETTASVKQEIDGENIWQQYLSLHPFHVGLHGTMRLVYLAVYGAYENFLVRSLSIAHNGKPIRVTSSDFKKDFRDKLGVLIDDAWFAEDIRIARLVRHSLMHAGGRVTDDLRRCKIPLVVHNDFLNVFPEHVFALYNALKVPALAVMQAVPFCSKDSEPADARESPS
ncbi:hypothetical protein [Novipirellula sp.]|uniref:hypothetical protein n=1 Tax=Novipirellula sp. TaxID=2795430 RepID=UPI0035691603